MVKLGVNIDHIATLRQARLEKYPSPLAAALVCQKAGADGITVHLREDRRHIQERDVLALKKNLSIKLNLEMALSDEILKFALKLRPDDVCLVPEKRRELTTEGGLDVAGGFKKIAKAVAALKKRGICVSLFIDPDFKQILKSKQCGADAVELHTGKYALSFGQASASKELKKLCAAAEYAASLGLIVNAGHGLDYANVEPIAKIPGINELNIGFSIIAESVFTGISEAVKKMKKNISSSTRQK